MIVLVAGVFALLTLISTAYWVYAWACIVRFRRRPPALATALPPVTVLKPLCGAHPGLYESLCSFCEQDYPEFQIVFGVRQATDPAVEIVQRLMDEFRARNLKLVVNDRAVAANPKVSNLANLSESAEHDVLVIADSDISVGRDYLRSVVAPLADSRVGLVTCLYGGRGSGRSWGWGALGRLFIEDWFFPSALVSATGGTLRHAFGATLVFRRRALTAVGGFAALGPYLADDYMLGALIARDGGRVVLSRYVAETRVVETSVRALFLHELRWSRTMRAVRPVGYFLAAVTFGFVWSALAMVGAGAAWLTAPSAWAIWPALIAGALHVTARTMVRRAVRAVVPSAARGPRWTALLLPVRDALTFAVWATSFMGRTVRWGRERFTVDGRGRIEPTA